MTGTATLILDPLTLPQSLNTASLPVLTLPCVNLQESVDLVGTLLTPIRLCLPSDHGSNGLGTLAVPQAWI